MILTTPADAKGYPARAAPVPNSRRAFIRVQRTILGGAGIALFIVLWEFFPMTNMVQPRFLPPASAVLATLTENLGLFGFWKAVGETSLAAALGLAMALAMAVLLGFMIGLSQFLRLFTHSTVEFLRPIPSVALIPIAVLLFGVKVESSLMLVFYAAFWQVFIQVLYGVADVDNVAMQTAKSFHLGWLARIRYVVFPTALPYLMTGIRLGATVALVLAITAELVIGSPGLGHEIAVAQASGAVTEVYALVVATGLIGVAINAGTRVIERLALSWHSSIRSEVVL